jgi:hypothetical protein
LGSEYTPRLIFFNVGGAINDLISCLKSEDSLTTRYAADSILELSAYQGNKDIFLSSRLEFLANPIHVVTWNDAERAKSIQNAAKVAMHLVN